MCVQPNEELQCPSIYERAQDLSAQHRPSALAIACNATNYHEFWCTVTNDLPGPRHEAAGTPPAVLRLQLPLFGAVELHLRGVVNSSFVNLNGQTY
jgi:hypothetical protein